MDTLQQQTVNSIVVLQRLALPAAALPYVYTAV